MDLKVCMVASYFHPKGYGGNAVYELCQHLVKLGLEVHVITSAIEGEPYYQLLQGIYIHRIPTYFLKLFNTEYPVSPTALGEILKVISNNDIDLVHAHFEIFPTTLASSIAKRIAGKPMVLTMHGQGLEGHSSYGTTILDTLWLINHITLERLVVQSADKIVALTRAVETKALKLGAKPNKISVIPNGVDTARFKPSNPSEEYYTELSINDEYKIVTFVGRLHPTHGVLLLLHAIPQVIKAHPESRFILVGDGPLRPYVLWFILSRGLEKYVRVLGYREDIPQLLNISDLFVYPALSVGMPLSVLEAMACGKPVIVTSVGDVPFLVKNGVNGIVIPSGNADLLADSIIYLAEKPELRNLIAEANIRKMAEYSWDKIAKQYRSLYSEIFDD